MNLVEKANLYIKNRKVKENDIYRPKYHVSPKVGWVNDPHGIVYFKGQYHLFCQHYPYETCSKDVHWGHFTTKDFIHFDEVRCAIAPDEPYDMSGCWSGSVIVENDKLFIFYTGFHLREDGKYYQVTCGAVSEDGINFKKFDNNPVIGFDKIPEYTNIVDFRDPCVFKENDKFYIIMGSKSKEEVPMVLLYESDDLYHWNFKKKLASDERYGTMFECPNLVRFKDCAYLITSPQNIPLKDDNFFNVSSCIYFRMPRDFINNDFKLENVREMDHGFDYYAPNVCDKEKIMVAWSQLWGRRYYLSEKGSDFINNFSLFKKIELDGDRLKFIPLDVYKTLFRNEEKHVLNLKVNEEITKKFGKYYHFEAEVEVKKGLIFELRLNKNDDECVLFTLNVDEKKLSIDRSKLKEQLFGVDNTPATKGFRFLNLDNIDEKFKFEIYADSEVMEVYVNDFKDSFSYLAFSNGEEVSFKANKDVNVKVIKQDVVVD